MKNKGSTLIETLIYILIFGLLSLAVLNALLSLMHSYNLINSSASLESVGETALEKMSREIRVANSLDSAGSTLGSSPGVLVLNTKDQTGADLSLKFSLSQGVIHIFENGTDQGPISTAKASVTGLIFSQITTPNSTGIRIELTAESGTSTTYKTEKFYTTAVIRGSYEQ